MLDPLQEQQELELRLLPSSLLCRGKKTGLTNQTVNLLLFSIMYRERNLLVFTKMRKLNEYPSIVGYSVYPSSSRNSFQTGS